MPRIKPALVCFLLFVLQSEKAIREVTFTDVAGRVQFHTLRIGNVIDISDINAGIYILTVQSTGVPVY